MANGKASLGWLKPTLRAVEDLACWAGVKAAAVARRVEAMASFMFSLCMFFVLVVILRCCSCSSGGVA